MIKYNLFIKFKLVNIFEKEYLPLPRFLNSELKFIFRKFQLIISALNDNSLIK